MTTPGGRPTLRRAGDSTLRSVVPDCRPRLRRWIHAVGIALLLGGGVVWADLDERTVRLEPDDLTIVARGETVYREQCTSCHGPNLAGQPNWRARDADGRLPAPPHDASGHTWHHDDDLLFEIVKYGPGAVIGDPDYASVMPAYESLLSDADIIAVLSFIVNAWPAEQREWQQHINAARFGPSVPFEEEGALERLFR